MIISHRLKFAYFRTPKTGSTTQEFMLRMCGAFDEEQDIMTEYTVGRFPETNIKCTGNKLIENGPHLTPQAALELGLMTMDQFREYDCYAFMREPKKRHVSACAHGMGRNAMPPEITRYVEADIYESILHPHARKRLGLLTIPQSEYFYVNGEIVVEALDTAHLERDLRRMIKRVGGVHLPVIPRMNVRSQIRYSEEQRRSVWKDVEIERFEEAYAEDIRLYNSIDNWPPEPRPDWQRSKYFDANALASTSVIPGEAA